MEKEQKILRISIAINFLLFIFVGILLIQNRAYKDDAEQIVGARQESGLIGIYNANAPVIPDGEGTALNVDSRGRLITSTSSIVTLTN